MYLLCGACIRYCVRYLPYGTACGTWRLTSHQQREAIVQLHRQTLDTYKKHQRTIIKSASYSSQGGHHRGIGRAI